MRISECKELDWISNSVLRFLITPLSITLSTHPRTLFIDVNLRCYLIFPGVNHMPHQHLIIFVGELIQTLRRNHINNLVFDNTEFSENTCLYASCGYRLNFFLLTFFLFSFWSFFFHIENITKSQFSQITLISLSILRWMKIPYLKNLVTVKCMSRNGDMVECTPTTEHFSHYHKKKMTLEIDISCNLKEMLN